MCDETKQYPDTLRAPHLPSPIHSTLPCLLILSPVTCMTTRSVDLTDLGYMGTYDSHRGGGIGLLCCNAEEVDWRDTTGAVEEEEQQRVVLLAVLLVTVVAAVEGLYSVHVVCMSSFVGRSCFCKCAAILLGDIFGRNGSVQQKQTALSCQ